MFLLTNGLTAYPSSGFHHFVRGESSNLAWPRICRGKQTNFRARNPDRGPWYSVQSHYRRRRPNESSQNEDVEAAVDANVECGCE